MQDRKKRTGSKSDGGTFCAQLPLDPLRRFVVFLENFAPFVNSLNFGIASPLLLGPAPLQLAQIKTQLALHQLNSVASNRSIASYALLNEAFLKIAMLNPRGNMPPRPRGPNSSGPILPGPFQGPRPGLDGLQRQHPPGPHIMPQRFVGSEMRAGFPRPNVQHGMDPRRAGERMNMERHQKEERRATQWDNPFPPGNSNQSQSTSGKTAEHATRVQSRYTPESASSILASFGLSNEDLEELSRYPDDQLTPENMPLILRDIRMRKMAHQLPSLPSQSREKENFRSDDGRASMVKSKVIDYGHESKYGYTEAPLEVKVYDSDVPNEQNMKGFPPQQAPLVTAAPSCVTNSQMNAVEELIRKMGFQRSTPGTQPFFPMDSSNKVPGLCLPSGTGVPPAAQPMMPVMPPVVPPMPVMPPIVPQALPPPPPIVQPMMPPMNQPPPPFVPPILEGVNRHGRIHHESRADPSNAPPGPTSGQKKFQKNENAIESPFGVVKASWLPVFSQADAQKLKRLPTPSMMNDYYAASPRIFPHVCSLCNIECRHLKDWIQHQNTTAHIENCRQLRQQFPDWNPEAHSSSKRCESDRRENPTARRRSASSSPRRSSSGHAWRRTRSRSRSPGHHRTSRPRSRSPRRRLSPRYRSRSPRRPQNFRLRSRRSSSKERELGRSTRSPDQDLEAAVKCLGPRFVEQFNKQKSLQALGRGASATKRTPPEPGKKTPNNPTVPPKPYKRDLPAHGSSDTNIKPPEAADTSDKGGIVAEGKNKQSPVRTPAKETNVSQPVPFNRLLTDKCLSCGTVLRISDLPDDGFSDNDIKKIVQPFGKVSDILVLRSRNEAFLEMNYKEAVIAAVKYGETVPVLVNGRRVKISVAEKSQAAPSQNKGNGKKAPQNVKKPLPSTPNTKKPPGAKKYQIASKIIVPATPATSASNDKKPGETQKVGETKAPLKLKKSTDVKKTRGTKTAGKQKKPIDPRKPEEAPKAAGSKKTTEPKTAVKSKAKEPGGTKTALKQKKPTGDSRKPEEAKSVESEKRAEPKTAVKSKAKETNPPAPVPDMTEAVKNTEASESVIKEAEDTCVVVISNLPGAGFAVDDITDLTKLFGKVNDVLIVSSHKKAYLEMSYKCADSMVKFYTCFPKWVEKNQLCITLAPEFKDIKNEEAIFVSMIKDANPKVNTESLLSQFVHLGNLPDGGYSELEILCVGLRFGRVDHYMVITNKNKAILQLDSAESAASMCRFLKRYPYSLGKSQLTFSRSPQIEPLIAEVTRKEVKKEEPSNESPDLNTFPEGSGVVHAAAVPSAKPTEAKEEPSSNMKADTPEVKTEKSNPEKVVCEAAPKSSKMEASKEDSGTEATTTPTVSVDLGPSEVKSEEVLTLTSNLEKKDKVTDASNAELLEAVSTAAGENKSEELTTPGGKPSEELPSTAKTESIGAGATTTVEGDTVAAVLETIPLDSVEAQMEDLSGGDLQSNNKLITLEANSTEASVNMSEMPSAQVGVVLDKETESPSSTAEANVVESEAVVMESEATVVEAMEVTKEKPELHIIKSETTLEKQPERLVPNEGATKEEKAEKNANEKSPEQILPKPSKGSGQSDESDNLTAESATGAEAISGSKGVLKTLFVRNTSKTRAATQRKEEQKPLTKPATRSRTDAEKKPVSKEISQQRPTSSRSNLTDSSKSKLNVSSLAVVLGSGKSSSQQDKDFQVEIKGSSKQARERENRSSSTKRESSSNKAFTRRTTRSSKSSTKAKEEEELSPFNLDEFVTMDEVVDEVESPSQPRRNTLRGKRKDVTKKNPPYEPSPKRRKGKNSAARVAESELSFVTLDEIGEDESGLAQTELLNLEVMPDSQALVTVDEVNDDDELIDDVIKDPQSLVTLDEISEQEDPAVHETAKDTFTLGDSESDLKAEPLVTVDEIGEVEEIPLNEPSHFKVDEIVKSKDDAKQVVDDPGDFLSSQIPEDPSTLVTVDEILEDSDDQPLVTLDEVTEDDEDFLADFNCMKEGLNFVTVDEVGSEDEEEEKNDTSICTNVEESVVKTVSEKDIMMPVAELGEDVADLEEAGIPDGTLIEKTEQACDEHLEETEALAQDPEKISVSVTSTVDRQATLDTKKDGGGGDLEKTSKTPEADTRCEQPLAEPILNQAELSGNKESNMREDQQPSEPESCVEGAVADATDRSSASTASEEKTRDDVQMPSPDLDVPLRDSQTTEAGEPDTRSELQEQIPGQPPAANVKEETSHSSEKPEKGLTGSECEEPGAKQRKVDSPEKSKAPSHLKDLDFLVPKAGFFCQICSCFCVDEASMKTHCQSQLHQQNMEKFMIKNAAEEEKGKGDGEEQSPR
ncbi:zinc finger protein 638 isoform X1 [Rhineura floridana]|uniref:zinc finger protein 638 isoform X1 n=1 Tax=Rhineura floridana TaxID=261503 RepID=UPI002AC877A8|nr:zinc finger protein 638 isoform X1 [Rhineura floridana]